MIILFRQQKPFASAQFFSWTQVPVSNHNLLFNDGWNANELRHSFLLHFHSYLTALSTMKMLNNDLIRHSEIKQIQSVYTPHTGIQQRNDNGQSKNQFMRSYKMKYILIPILAP